MKKHLLFLTLAAVLSLLPLGAMAQNVLDFGFEDGTIPATWTNDASHPWTVTNTSQGSGHTGTYCISSGNAGIASSSSEISATFTFTTAGSISFLGGIYGEGSTTPWDKCIFLIDDEQQFAYGALAAWDTYEYEVAAGTHTFTWKYTKDASVNPTGDAFFVDDISVVLTNTCPKIASIAFDTSSITSSGATINWTAGGSETSWAVYLDGQFVTISNSAEYTFTGLNANTAYTASVRAVCGNGDTSGIRAVAFRTACGATEIPWYEDFETAGTGVPYCFTHLTPGPSSSDNYCGVTTAVANGGTHALRFNYSRTTGNLLVLPEFSSEISGNQLRFWHRPESVTNEGCGTLEVGYITDTADTATFVVLQAYAYNDFESATYREDEVPYVDVPAGAMPAFRHTGTVTNWYWNIDDLRVEPIPTCQRPAAGSVSSITFESAAIQWNSVATTGTYEVRYSTVNDESDNNAQAFDVTDLSDTTTILAGLQPSTTYFVWVRTNCGGDVSLWRPLGSFHTSLSCYPVIEATVGNVNFSSAFVSWQYRGNPAARPETGVFLTLRDSSSIVRQWSMTYEEGSSTFITGLNAGTQYTIELRTLCDPDTASASVLAFTTSACGQVGDGSQTNSSAPFNRYFKYGYSQILYPMSAVSQLSDGITGIGFSSKQDRTKVYTVDVYIGETDQATLTSATAIPYNELTLVAQGVQMTSHIGYNPIMFDTVYVPTGHHANLVVVVDNNTGSYDGSGFTWSSHVAPNTTLYYQNDATNADPANPPSLSAATYRPDIVFYGNCAFTCLAPNLMVENVGINSVDMRWARGLDESSWAVRYKADTATAWINHSEPSDTTCTISGLDPRTRYNFQVAALCAAGDTIWSNVVSLFTDCAPLDELPLSEGFENMPTGAGTNPLCWQFIKTSTSSSDNHYVSTTSPHGGQQCMYFYPYNDQYLISPAMPEGTNPTDLEINFWAKIPASGNSRIDVGLMTDPTDTATFRKTTSYGSNSSAWTEYTLYIDTTTLTADDIFYVAFRVYSTGSYSIYVDDVVIQNATCKRPTQLALTSLSYNTATLTWHGQEGASYEYCVTTIDSIPDSVMANLGSGEDTTATFTNLNGYTVYHVWVRTVCDGEPTPWASAFTFRTPCTPETTPWLENFDDWASNIDVCWSRYTGFFSTTPSLTSTTSGWNTSTNSMGGSRSVKVNVYGTGCNYWIVTPLINVVDNCILTFDVTLTDYASGNPPDPVGPDDRFVIAASTDGGIHWTPLYQFGGDSIRDDEPYTSLNNVPRTITVPVFDYNGEAINIAFYGESTVSGGDNDLHIDNISIQPASCMRPVNLTADPDLNEIQISWQDLSTENDDGYILVVNTEDTIAGPAAHTYEIPAGDTSFTVTGLAASTSYYIFMRSACAETVTESSWSSISVRTLCGEPTLPFFEGFEGMPTGTGTNPICWQFVQTGTSGSHYVSTTSPHSGSACMYFYPYNYHYLISPAMPAGTDPASLEITFWAKISAYGSSNIEVGLMTDSLDITTFRPMSSQGSNNGTWTEYSVYTDTSTIDANSQFYVAFRVYCNNGYANYLDDISIANAGCRRPSGFEVVNLSPNSATLSWNNVSDADGYRVVYTVNDSTQWTDSVDVTNHSVTIDNLQTGTNYRAWVYTICGNGLSDPRGPLAFTTEKACYPILNLRQTGSTGTSAAFMWDNDERGYEATGALVVLRDNTDSTSTDTMATDGVNYHFFTDLDRSHSYTATFLTQCDADTATAVSTAIVFDPCASITGTSSVTHSPFSGLYNYGTSQVLYPRSIIGNMTIVNGLQWYVSSIPSSYPVRTIDVYVGTTDSTTLTVASALPASAMTKVVSNGQLNVGQTGWTTITFDSTWNVPDSGSNIVVAVVNKTGSWSSIGWRGHSGNGIYGYQDGTLSNYFDVSAYSNNGVDTAVADISFMGDCQFDETACVAPAAVVTSVDSTNATIIWTGNTDAYTVQYRSLAEHTWLEAENTTSPATLAELQPGTSYAVRVGALCADGDTLWSNTLGFTTMCALMHLPLDFAQAEMQAANTYGISPCFDWQSFSLSSSYVSTSSNNAWFALPAIAEPLNGAQLRTSVAATSSSATSMRVGVMEADGSITWVDTVALPHASSSSDVTEQVVYLDSYTGTGNRVVVGSMSSNYMYFREIHVENLDACRRVNDVQVSNITESGATVTWTPGEGQTQWLVYVDGQQVATATAATYDITGVASSTTHTVAIRAFCGGADTARAVGTSFTTLCDAIATLPWNEDFTNSATGSMPNCWDQYFTGTTASYAPHVVSSSSYQQGLDGNFIYILASSSSSYGQDVVVVLPVFSADINTLEMIFSYEYESSSYGTLEVGYITGSDYNSDFVVVETCAVSTDATVDTVNFSAASATATRIAFRWTNNYSTYYTVGIDNITVQTASAGPGPQPQNCDAPVVTSAVADGNTITLSWTGAATQYQVASTLGAWTNPTPEAVVNATTYTFENLSAGSYTVGVRAVCEEGGFSAWATRSVTVGGGEGIDDVDGLVIALFPNPAAEQVTLQLGEASEVCLVDQSGRTAGRYSLDAGTSVLDLSQYASGVYYVRVVSTSGTSVRKLVVK